MSNAYIQNLALSHYSVDERHHYPSENSLPKKGKTLESRTKHGN